MAGDVYAVVPSSSSSSPSASRWSTYDVFLSFRGEDTRNNFTHDLYDALVKKNIETFKDDEKLKIGDLISEALKKAIKESRFAIIIFSTNYANSRWCLEELALIMEECWEKKHHCQKDFPVFLKGVDPLDVEHQKGSFGEPFEKHEKRFGREMVGRWRSALRTAAQLSGWSFIDFGLMANHTVIPSSSASGWNYDVILSLKQEEKERGNNFASNLCASLEGANIKTFKDYERSKRGDQISAALIKGINESRCAIILFSRNYASSIRCLEELSLIMECREKLGQKVFPVFLRGVEGSDVRRQKGSFGEPFRLHQECFEPEVVKRWRSALEIAGELRGWNLKDKHGDEEMLIKKIVKDVSNALSEIPSPKPVIEIPTEPIEIQPSTQRMLQKMLDCICDPDPEIGIFGIYGMGGVGKTTLAKQLNNHLEKDLARGVKIPFEIVIMVTVSATANISSIQTSIGKRLGLLDNSEADVLFATLRKKNFFLILDDVWCKLKLEDVGIPHPRKNKGSKILVISRDQNICTDMGASKTIKVQPLSEAESWELFVELAGEHVADGIKCFAEKIVRRCKGLPLAIVTVAHAMANRHGVGEWANAVREMDLSATNLRGMINEVLLPLKFSFDRLEDDTLRSLFLYCACFPEDHSIRKREILCYCIGEGLVDRLGSLEGARNKGEALIGSLKIACMLENGEKKGSVKMHDMMRDLALWITSSLEFCDSSPKFLIRTGRSVKEAPKAHDWVDASRISLLDTEIGQLPELGEKCQKLTTLLSSNVSFGNNRIHNLLSSNVSFGNNRIHNFIPPTNFFRHMNHLSILNLSDSQTLEYLPDSLSCLVNLRVLMLRRCVRLKALPAALGMLQQLQVLDLKSCVKLHQQILGSECEGGVSNLRYLDVSYSPVSIPAGVISRLHKLEELRLYGTDNIKWKLNSGAEDEKWNIGSSGSNHHKVHTREEEDDEEEEDERSGGTEGSSATSDTDSVDSSMINNIIDVEELSHLTSLTSLTIAFENIIISDWFKPLAKLIMRLELRRCRVVRQDALQALNESQNLRFLVIKDCAGVTCVPTHVETSLTIDNCEDLEKVLDGVEEEVHHQDSFKGLNLFRLPNLNRICGSLAPLNCFAQLRWINIWQCNSLKMVFTKGMPCLFNNLEWISVEECNAMKVIIEEADDKEEEEVGVISPFPRLRKLCLVDLPSLHDLCSNHILHCPIIREVYVRNCPRLKKGFLHKYEMRTAYLSSSRGKSGRTKAIIRSWKRKLLKLLHE